MRTYNDTEHLNNEKTHYDLQRWWMMSDTSLSLADTFSARKSLIAPAVISDWMSIGEDIKYEHEFLNRLYLSKWYL